MFEQIKEKMICSPIEHGDWCNIDFNAYIKLSEQLDGGSTRWVFSKLIFALQEAEKEQNIKDEPKNKMLNKLLEVGQAGGLTPEAIGLKLAELILEREKAEDMAGKYAQCQSELAAKQNDLAECNQEIEQLKDVASGYHEEL